MLAQRTFVTHMVLGGGLREPLDGRLDTACQLAQYNQTASSCKNNATLSTLARHLAGEEGRRSGELEAFSCNWSSASQRHNAVRRREK